MAHQADQGIKTTCPIVEQASPIQSRKILQFFGSGLSEASIKNSRTCDEASSSLGGYSAQLKQEFQNKQDVLTLKKNNFMLGKSLNDDLMQLEDDELLKELTMGLKAADSAPPNRRYSNVNPIYQSFNN